MWLSPNYIFSQYLSFLIYKIRMTIISHKGVVRTERERVYRELSIYYMSNTNSSTPPHLSCNYYHNEVSKADWMVWQRRYVTCRAPAPTSKNRVQKEGLKLIDSSLITSMGRWHYSHFADEELRNKEVT